MSIQGLGVALVAPRKRPTQVPRRPFRANFRGALLAKCLWMPGMDSLHFIRELSGQSLFYIQLLQ